MNILTDGHTTLKRVIGNGPGIGTLDSCSLLLSHDGVYRVHLERREHSGAITDAYLFQGTSTEQANNVYNRIIRGIS